MKNLIKYTVAAGLLVSSLSARAAEVSVGVVNFQRAMQEVKHGQSAKASLEKQVETKRKEIEKLKKEVQKLGEDFQKSAAVLSEKARQEKGMAVQEKAAK